MRHATSGEIHWRLHFASACLFALLAPLPRSASAQQQMIIGPVSTVDIDANDPNEAAKTSGFSIKKEDQKLIEQFDDFERFKEKKAWDRAFKSIDALRRFAS